MYPTYIEGTRVLVHVLHGGMVAVVVMIVTAACDNRDWKLLSERLWRRVNTSSKHKYICIEHGSDCMRCHCVLAVAFEALETNSECPLRITWCMCMCMCMHEGIEEVRVRRADNDITYRPTQYFASTATQTLCSFS